MIAERFLKPFNNQNHQWVRFIKSATDEELKELGWTTFFLYPDEIRKQMMNHLRSQGEYDFVEDYITTYGLQQRMTSKDKARWNKLYQLLKLYPDLTAKEFFDYR